MAKKNNSNAYLLGRIYERTELIPEIKQDIKEVKSRQDIIREVQLKDHERIRTIEKTSGGYILVKIIKSFLRI